jgi:hypothetical protein
MENKEKFECADCGCSASESLPDYDANSSAKDYMSQAESYLDDAVYKLEEVINTNKRN